MGRCTGRTCFNTQPPEGGWLGMVSVKQRLTVSTHSRLKAAGGSIRLSTRLPSRFNTQPPEGGWIKYTNHDVCCHCFNTQPPEGGWLA